MIHFRKKRSGHIAKDRLKLLLVSERLSCSPQMMTMLQNDVVSAVERYIKENMTFLIKIPLKIDIQESYPGF